MKLIKYFLMIILSITLTTTSIMADVADVDDDEEETTKVYLSAREQSIVIISIFTANGDLENLKKIVKFGLTNGEMTVNEIKEVMTFLYAYCGFPRSVNALKVLMDISKNGAYMVGPSGAYLEKDANKNKIGTKKQTKLVGKKVKEELYQFAPAIDIYLKEHLYADLFSRGILTDSEREFATIAALSTMDGVELQLKEHIQMCKNIDVKQEKIDSILILSKKIKETK